MMFTPQEIEKERKRPTGNLGLCFQRNTFKSKEELLEEISKAYDKVIKNVPKNGEMIEIRTSYGLGGIIYEIPEHDNVVLKRLIEKNKRKLIAGEKKQVAAQKRVEKTKASFLKLAKELGEDEVARLLENPIQN